MATVKTHEWKQEWYETGSPDLRPRTAHLRRLGLTVTVAPMGRQITSVGSMKMTLLDVRRNNADECIWDTV